MVFQFKRLMQYSAVPPGRSLSKLYLQGTPPRRAFASSDPYGGLKTAIVGYWKLGEATGLTRIDSSSTGNDLANNNNVSQVAGQIGNASNFVSASLQYLSIPSNASLQPGGVDFTIAGWLKTSTGIDQGLVSKWGSAAAAESYLVEIIGNKLRWFVANGAGGSADSVVTTASVQNGAWRFFVCDYNDTTKLIRVILDGDIAGAITKTSAVSMAASTGAFEMGRYSGSIYYNGALDAVGIWKRLLSNGEIAQLYNGGTGIGIYR